MKFYFRARFYFQCFYLSVQFNTTFLCKRLVQITEKPKAAIWLLRDAYWKFLRYFFVRKVLIFEKTSLNFKSSYTAILCFEFDNLRFMFIFYEPPNLQIALGYGLCLRYYGLISDADLVVFTGRQQQLDGNNIGLGANIKLKVIILVHLFGHCLVHI